jgi:DNA-binding HxlR family transcriptional regulator
VKVTNVDLQMITLEEKLKKYSEHGDCPVRNVLDRIGDKWSILVISLLGDCGTLRFNELNHKIGNISQKMLTVTLKSLEADGLISRKIYPVIPPKVEYTLTPLGDSLLPALEHLTHWAFEKMPEVLESRRAYAER